MVWVAVAVLLLLGLASAAGFGLLGSSRGTGQVARGGLGLGVRVRAVQMGMDGSDGGMGEGGPAAERSTIPMRRDTCRLLVSGVVGGDPKETFLAIDNNYVLNFPLAVVGHFNAVHDWEKFKPTETMWLSCELWNDEARRHAANIYKGAPLSGIATLIFNKWTDKTTGEERKMFKARLTNVLTAEELAEMLGSSGIEDLVNDSDSGAAYGEDPGGGSGFANDSPDMYDQAPPPPPRQQQQQQQQGAWAGRGGGAAAVAPPPTKRVARAAATMPPAPPAATGGYGAAPRAPAAAPSRYSRELDDGTPQPPARDSRAGPTIPF